MVKRKMEAAEGPNDQTDPTQAGVHISAVAVKPFSSSFPFTRLTRKRCKLTLPLIHS